MSTTMPNSPPVASEQSRSGNGSPPARMGLLSIVLPAFNEQEVLPLTHARLSAMGPVLAQWQMDYELLFVNDGSHDDTARILNRLAAEDPHVRAIHLTRNFGHQAAVTAGLTLARGNAVAVMDCDLQDPPEELPRFLAKWREGFQVVYAVRRKRKEWFGKRLAYWAFYRLLGAISDIPIPLDSGDFCVMDRSAVDLLNSLPERQRFVRGLRTWIGLRQTGVTYERLARQAGQPAYTWRSLLKLAMDGLVGFSSVPLRLVTRLGLVGVALAMALAVWVVLDTIFIHRAPRGWASLACLVLLMSSVQLLALGIIGEYLARVFVEVKGRPTFLIAGVVEHPAARAAEAPAANGVTAAASAGASVPGGNDPAAAPRSGPPTPSAPANPRGQGAG